MSAPAPRISPGGRREIGLVNTVLVRVAGAAIGREVPHVFTTLARHPGLFRRWLLFAGGLMPGGRLPRRETELAILRVSRNMGCDYERDHHERIGRRAGLTAAEIERACGEAAPSETAPGETAPGEIAPGETAPGETAPSETAPSGTAPGQIAAGQTAPGDGWTGRDGLVLRAADALQADGVIGDELWSELAAAFDERELIELCMLVGHYEMLAMTLNTLRVQLDPPPRPGSGLRGRLQLLSGRGGRR